MKRCLETSGLDQNILPQSKDESPPKKRKLERKKPESPPWKNALADGPSSFTQEGRRRSGRVNSIPLDLQPTSDKVAKRSVPKPCITNGKRDTKETKGRNPTLKTARYATTSNVKAKNSRPSPPSYPSKTSNISASPRYSNRKLSQNTCKTKPLVDHKSLSASTPPLALAEVPEPTHVARSEDIVRKGTRNRAKIKLRIKPPTLPLVHPGLVLSRPKQYSNLIDYFQHARYQHINEGGLFHPEDPSEYPSSSALKDALIILRAEQVAKPGGILAPGRCRVYNEPEESQQITRKYSHLDHMCRAAIGFKKLMLAEQKNHRQTAKRIAEACRDEWTRRQPKTSGQLEAEFIAASRLRYKGIVKTLQIIWDNVKTEVNRRRLVEWEKQEQARVKKALSEAVDKSQQKLRERKAHQDPDMSSEEDETQGETDINDEIGSNLDSENEESNMTSEDSEADEDEPLVDFVEDESLTVEQLREKYAALHSQSDRTQVENIIVEGETSYLAKVNKNNLAEIKSTCENSDESISMDDHLDSSDDNKDCNSEKGDEDEGVEENAPLGYTTNSDLKNVEQGEIRPMEMSTTNIVEKNDLSPASTKEIVYAQTSAASDHLDGDPEMNGSHDKAGTIDAPAIRTTTDLATSDPETKTKSTSKSSEGSSHQKNLTPVIAEGEPVPSNLEDAQNNTTQPNKQIKTLVPFLLRGTLREYQHYGLDWLAGLYANNTNGILADEMGLGKTIQTISLLAHLACEHHEWGPHLVIVPTSVILNWEMEFKKWCPGFKIMTYYGTIEERKKKRTGWKNKDAWNVCITSYQIIIRDQQVFKRRRWHYMILDEAHNIKNFNSQRWQTMLTFNTRARLLLTGTPLQNNLTELWSLLYFLMPSDGTKKGVGGFADLQEFQDWFKKPSEQILEHGLEQIDNESRGLISKLHQLLRPYLLRRLKADVEKQMPAKYEHVEYCRLSKRQRELYDGFLSREETRGTLASGNYLSIINCLMQLRKVCNHPDLFIDRPVLTSFPMEKSAVADFEIKELFIRRRLLKEDLMSQTSLEFLNLVPTKYETLSDTIASRISTLSVQRTLMETREIQRLRAQNAHTSFDPTTAKSNLIYLEKASRWSRFEELQHCVYLNALHRQKRPIYGSQLIEFLTLRLNQHQLQPKRRDTAIEWLKYTSPIMKDLIKPLAVYAENSKSMIQKFACLTPAVVAKDITYFALTPRGVAAVQNFADVLEQDPFHEARMRLSIQFPDKRLLQYDCGKLQTLDKLLRKLQAGGHRALIFTQMTKVLDILEQFLNIHGHKYLRLDGSTKVEQRQILTDRFNNDSRILVFILSSRSGGLGINLTGADTVIFYDLDWNPAMDKQCQDRCHRIGQTRDVHIYRFISEHTIEANILRKANQKRMLDDFVIQEGEFTTEHFSRIAATQGVIPAPTTALSDNDAVANAAMERIFGAPDHNEVRRVLSQAEDREDVLAARLAEQERVQTDAADFDDSSANAVVGDVAGGDHATTGDDALSEDAKLAGGGANEDDADRNALGDRMHTIDDYMLKFMNEQLKDTSVELPKDRSKSKRGRDYRSHHRLR
ncbi:Helicase [Podosphaera aphanis]|nr:Helicase [Podosphaera aphanis]